MTHDPSGAPLSRRAFGTRIALGAAALAATPDLTHALGESAGGVHDPSTAGAATPAMPATPSLAQEQDPMMRTMQRFVDDLADGNAQMKERIAPSRPRQIAMMAYPGMYPLDLGLLTFRTTQHECASGLEDGCAGAWREHVRSPNARRADAVRSRRHQMVPGDAQVSTS
jgi:hypothetical protein